MAANIFRSSNLPYLALAAAIVVGLSMPAMAQSPASLFTGKAKKPAVKVLPFVQPSELAVKPIAPLKKPGKPGTVKPKFFVQPSELDESQTGIGSDLGAPDTSAPPVDGGIGGDVGPQGGVTEDPSLQGDGPALPEDPMGAGLPIDPNAGSQVDPNLPADPSADSQVDAGQPVDPQDLPAGVPLPSKQPLPTGPFPGSQLPVNPNGINPADLYHPQTGGYMPPSHCQPQQCYYKLITTWTYKQVPYQVKVVRYDHCGKPYCTYITQYHSVKVPVQQYVKVCN